MYYIQQVIAVYNYDEDVVTTTLFARDMDDENVIYKKILSSDRTEEQMQSFTKSWSLTTLSISTGIDTSELISQFGKSFKRCYVRFNANSVLFDIKQKLIRANGTISVSLDSDFSSPREFHLQNDSSMPEDFMKKLELTSVVGFVKS